MAAKDKFSLLTQMAEREARLRRAPTDTIIKELLHYDILYALSQSQLARRLVFQGGTALRLAYGGQRFSEDLDFVCPGGLERGAMDEFKKILSQRIKEAYGLMVDFSEPSGARVEDGRIGVQRWKARIALPNSNRASPQKQVVHIEVADVPSYQPSPRALQPNYEHLPAAFQNIFLRVESLSEIMADKVVAIAGRPYFKARDIWDVVWLIDKGVSVDMALVTKKVADYNMPHFNDRLQSRLAALSEPDTQQKFVAEMSRFVDGTTGRWLDAELAASYCQRVQSALGHCEVPMAMAPVSESQTDGFESTAMEP